MTHKVLFDYHDRKGKDHYIDPRLLLDALDDAKAEIGFSNYTCGKIDLAKKIIRLWCKSEGIKIGPTQETVVLRELKWHQQNCADLASGDLDRTNQALDRMQKKRNRS